MVVAGGPCMDRVHPLMRGAVRAYRSQAYRRRTTDKAEVNGITKAETLQPSSAKAAPVLSEGQIELYFHNPACNCKTFYHHSFIADGS